MVEISVKEVCECVCSVLINSGFDFFVKWIMVNFVLVDIFKYGGWFDLFIVVGILVVLGYFFDICLYDIVLVGELGLNGEIKFVGGLIFILMVSVYEGLLFIFLGVNDVEVVMVFYVMCFFVFDLFLVYEYFVKNICL